MLCGDVEGYESVASVSRRQGQQNTDRRERYGPRPGGVRGGMEW